MLLLQISDTHFGPTLRMETLRETIKEINNNKETDARLKIIDGDCADSKEIMKRKKILQASDISQYSDSIAQ
jgi:hypothetical protein